MIEFRMVACRVSHYRRNDRKSVAGKRAVTRESTVCGYIFYFILMLNFVYHFFFNYSKFEGSCYKTKQNIDFLKMDVNYQVFVEI